jgi:hypothetical protein
MSSQSDINLGWLKSMPKASMFAPLSAKRGGFGAPWKINQKPHKSQQVLKRSERENMHEPALMQ